jgi:hypothetical protein
MNSFLKTIEKKFVLLNESIDLDNTDSTEDVFNEEDELDEQNVTSAVAGYDIPAAFSKRGADNDTVEVLGMKRVKRVRESINTPPTYKPGEYQRPECEEEEFNEKFPFANSEKDWFNHPMYYPSKDLTDTPGMAKLEDMPPIAPVKPLADIVGEAIDKKYEQLIESYKQFAVGDAKSTPEQKVKNTIKEVAKKLQEIETLVNHTSRLKTESGLSRTNIGSAADKALTKISERLIKISERVRALGE